VFTPLGLKPLHRDVKTRQVLYHYLHPRALLSCFQKETATREKKRRRNKRLWFHYPRSLWQNQKKKKTSIWILT
jgi:hypothetical protein